MKKALFEEKNRLYLRFHQSHQQERIVDSDCSGQWIKGTKVPLNLEKNVYERCNESLKTHSFSRLLGNFLNMGNSQKKKTYA